MSTNTRTTTYSPDASALTVRDVEQDGEFYRVTTVISSTAQARDGEAFSRERLRGFAEQIRQRRVSVFLDHGRNESTGARYSALGKLGFLEDPELADRDGVTDLEADMVILDPDDLASEGDVGPISEALRFIRQQAEAGMLTVSVGWSEDTDGRDVPGDAELQEVSVVGIGADPRANQTSSDVPAAVRSGFDALPSAGTTASRTETNRAMWEPDPPTDAERAVDALERLWRYKDRNTPARTPPAGRDTHPMTATIEEVLRLFGADGGDADTDAVADRLATLRGTDSESRQQRTDALERLSTVRDHRERYPHGRSSRRAQERTDGVLAAVDELRELLTETDHAGRTAPFGFEGLGGEERGGHRASAVEERSVSTVVSEAFDALGRRRDQTFRQLRATLDATSGRHRIRDAVADARRDRPSLDATLGDIAALRRDLQAEGDDDADRALDRLRRGLIAGRKRGGGR
jgi:hypothetical protein